MNKVEEALRNSELSIKQLKKNLKLSKNQIKYYIYISKNIGDVNPLLYGSCKSKINVYKWVESDLSYIQRKKIKVRQVVPVSSEVPQI